MNLETNESNQQVTAVICHYIRSARVTSREDGEIWQ